MKTSSLGEAWLVILLALVFGMALAAVHGALSPIIRENLRLDTLGQIPALVPGAVEGIEEQRGGVRCFRARGAGGETAGWVISRSGGGFADRITALVGLDDGLERITGVYILQQSETPGLGDRIRTEEFRARFRGRPTRPPLRAVKAAPETDTDIEGVTGATVSSQSVVQIVNQAVAEMLASEPADPNP